MSGTRKPWHSGRYARLARIVRTIATANPNTRCRRCSRTLADIHHRDGTPARWTAGHVNRAETNGQLGPECSVCAAREGAAIVNASRRARAHDWY